MSSRLARQIFIATQCDPFIGLRAAGRGHAPFVKWFEALKDGWIERFQQEDVSRDKQAYRLTGAGRVRLQAELERLKNITKAVSARLRASEA